MMRRPIGLLVILALGLLMAPLAAMTPSTARVARLGILAVGTPPPDLLQAFSHTLRELGWVDGQNLAFEWRVADGDPAQLPALAAELVRLPVDLIVAGSAPAVRAAQQASRTIPIVMTGTADPMRVGFVESLARPGGNITGLSTMQVDLTSKWLELLKAAAPGIGRVGVLTDPAGISTAATVREAEQAAAGLGMQVHPLEVADPRALAPVSAAIAAARTDALLVLPSPRLHTAYHQIVAFVAQTHLPAIYPARWYVEAGGLMSYEQSRLAMVRRAAAYVDKILRGTKPADLPVEQPTTFGLVINLKTAEALGLTISPALLFQADELIR